MIQKACPSSMEATPTSPPPLPVRVGYLVSTRSYGGPERQIVGVARALDRSRFSLIIITFVCHPSEERPLLTEARNAGIPTATVHMPSTFDPRGISRLLRTLRDENVAVLCPFGYKADVLGWIAGRMLRLPLLATCGGWTGHSWSVRQYERVDRWVYRLMDRVIAVSEATRQQLICSGVPSGRVVLVPNAVDTQHFHPHGTSDLREKLGISAETVVVAAVARLSPEKGHRYLVEAFSRLSDKTPVHLVLAGDGPERVRLERTAASMALSQHITFLGWCEDVRQVYWASDIIALPSLTEGLPCAVLEAMACGKPVVASDVGGVAEALGRSGAGMLVPACDSLALAGALSDLIADPHVALRMGQSARRRAEGMTFGGNARRMEAAWGQLARNSDANRAQP